MPTEKDNDGGAVKLTFREAIEIVEAAGMSVWNGFGFCGGTSHLREMNGWPVEDIAEAVAERKAKE